MNPKSKSTACKSSYSHFSKCSLEDYLKNRILNMVAKAIKEEVSFEANHMEMKQQVGEKVLERISGKMKSQPSLAHHYLLAWQLYLRSSHPPHQYHHHPPHQYHHHPQIDQFNQFDQINQFDQCNLFDQLD